MTSRAPIILMWWTTLETRPITSCIVGHELQPPSLDLSYLVPYVYLITKLKIKSVPIYPSLHEYRHKKLDSHNNT